MASDDFIEQFLKYSKEYESPGSFWKWGAYVTIASILRDNIYHAYKERRTYVNIYVLELADSGAHRKGAPLQLSQRLVKEIGMTKIISGRNSIQSVLDDLVLARTDIKSGQVIKGGSGTFYAEELSSSIVEDPQAIRILTDIYDSRAEYGIGLKGSGKSTINNLCFSMFAASNEELLKSVYTTSAVYGGLLGRTFLVKPNEFRPSNSLLFEEGSIRNGVEFIDLVNSLKIISKLTGEVKFTVEAAKAYNKWYGPFRANLQTTSDKSGILARLHMGVLKLSIILAAAKTFTTTVEKCHFEEALSECTELLPNYSGYVMSSGRSDIAIAGQVIIADLFEAKDYQMSRRDILSKHWTDVDGETLDKLMRTLEEAGIVTSIISDGPPIYRLSKTAIEKMKG